MKEIENHEAIKGIMYAIENKKEVSVIEEMKRDVTMLKSGLFDSDKDQKLKEEGAIACLENYIPKIEGEFISRKELREQIEKRKSENEVNYDPDPDTIFPILRAEKKAAIAEDEWVLALLEAK